MTVPAKGARLSTKEAERLTKKCKSMYAKGASIREIADETGRSYGWVHGALINAGVNLRGRGGATRKKGSA